VEKGTIIYDKSSIQNDFMSFSSIVGHFLRQSQFANNN